MTRSTFSTMAVNVEANASVGSAGCCRDIRARLRCSIMGVALAVDIGGTKVSAGLVDDRGRLSVRHDVRTPATTDPAEMWAAVASVVDTVRTADLAVCGVGCGGPMRRGLVSPLNI